MSGDSYSAKLIFPLVFFLTFSQYLHSQTGPDEPGELMFVGFNADGTDGFAFVSLVDIEDGYQIRFTDNNWDGSVFTTSEGDVLWTNSTGAIIGAGTVISLYDFVGTTPVTSSGSVSEEEAIDLNASDETLYAIIGTVISPITFLSAIKNDDFAGTELTNTQLNAGFEATQIDGDEDILIYSGTTTCSNCVRQISNPANWSTQDSSGDQSQDGSFPDFPDDVTSDITIMQSFPADISADLSLWLQADRDVLDAGLLEADENEGVETWVDQNLSINNASQTTGADQPTFQSDAANTINFNPVLSLDGTDFFDLPDGTFPSGTTDYTLFVVTQPTDPSTTSYLLSAGNNAMDEGGLFGFSGSSIAHDYIGNTFVGGIASANEVVLATFTYDHASSTTRNIFKSGTNVGTNAAASKNFGNTNNRIGANLSAGGDFFDGNLAEIIVYSDALDPVDQQKIESYLAIKYGITLDQASDVDYLASNGGVIWDASDNLTYNHDIAGLGRDDETGLSQLKSKSANSTSLLTIAVSDMDTPAQLSANDSWLLWGSDGQATTFTASIINTAGSVVNRMERIWRVRETGTIDIVEIVFDNPTGLQTLSLIVHPSSPGFPNDGNREVYEMQNDGSMYRVSVDFEDGDYFTFAEGKIDGLPGILITEVVTDPQQDWSTDEFHNPNPSSGTLDENDEWVELFVTEDDLNLTGWTIELNDGSDISGSLLAGGAFVFSNYNSLSGGLFQATDSGDYLILGNVNGGDMEDIINVILKDANGNIVDQVDIGTPEKRKTDFTGVATGLSDESVTRLIQTQDTNSDSTDFVLTQASLDAINSISGIVLINEIVTDPQTDWGTNSFDGSDGATDTTAVDEWIELYIATDDLNLTGWVLDIENNTNDIVQENLEAGGAFTLSNYFSNTGGTFTKTDSGDYLVLGNAANGISLRNDIDIILYDPFGNIVDQVALGNGGSEAPSGDADGFEDEAVARYPNAIDTDADNADFIQTRPTLGSTNSPTGIVLINEVVTDPQQDWNTNLWDGTFNPTDTTDSDEWVELYIASDSINLTNWVFDFDGTASTLTGNNTSGWDTLIYISNTTGSSFVNTRAGDYVILGDPTGNMNLNVFITLTDTEGNLIDDVEIGDDDEGDGDDGAPSGGSSNGSATGISDEAIARIPNGNDTDNDINDFTTNFATLGRANATMPSSVVGNAILANDGSDFGLIFDD
ncbi:MAG: hypothetical protein AAGC88_11430, partial [Bacteroidota bacterium]